MLMEGGMICYTTLFLWKMYVFGAVYSILKNCKNDRFKLRSMLTASLLICQTCPALKVEVSIASCREVRMAVMEMISQWYRFCPDSMDVQTGLALYWQQNLPVINCCQLLQGYCTKVQRVGVFFHIFLLLPECKALKNITRFLSVLHSDYFMK